MDATQNDSVDLPRSTLCFHKLNRLELRFLFTFDAALTLDRQSTTTTSPTRYRCQPLFPGSCVTKAAFLAAVFASFELLIGQRVPDVWMACRVLFGVWGREPSFQRRTEEVSPALSFNFLAPSKTRKYLVKIVESRVNNPSISSSTIQPACP